MVLVASAMVFRHGQRSPYPPPGGDSAAGTTAYSSRPMPSASMWNMTQAAFDEHWLTPHGHALMHHLGQFYAHTLNASCDIVATLIADGTSHRDVESAEEFAAGFFLETCSAERVAQVVAATESDPVLIAVADDRQDAGCNGPDEDVVRRSFGGDVDALTAAYRTQIDRVSDLIGCCAASVCEAHGLAAGANCTLADLPYEFDPHRWWNFYGGPLGIAGYYSDAFVLQATSGLEYAWGELNLADLADLNRLHQRAMWLGATHNSSRAYGSHTLAYLLAHLDNLKSGSPPASGSAPNVLAIFGHDFNIMYLRSLLNVHWLTDSWNVDAATTGSCVSLELHWEANGPSSVGASESGEWRVVGALIAASMEQQRHKTPLVPPHAPPGRATFLDMPYDAFRSHVIGAIDSSCVREPLRSTIIGMQPSQQRALPSAGDADRGGTLTVPIGGAIFACLALLLLGCACGTQLRRLVVLVKASGAGNRRSRPRQPLRQPKQLMEVTSVGVDGSVAQPQA
jgi:hypothetical protein